MKKIKILFRLRSMEMGGCQKVMIELLKNLNRNKYEITLLLTLHQGILIKEIPSDINVKFIGQEKESMSKVKIIKTIELIIRRFKILFYTKFPSILYKIKGIKDMDYEVAFMLDNLYNIINSPIKNSKKIAWIHGDITSIESKAQKEGYAFVMEKYQKVIYVSNSTKEAAKTVNPNLENNAVVIYNPIDVDDILVKSKANPQTNISSSNIKSFISIGRIYPGKDYSLLIEAHLDLIKEGLHHKIYIIGDGYQKKELEEKVKKHKIEHSFIFLGEFSNPYPIVKQADFFILPTWSEAYPLVIAEALVLEKPTICSEVGGVPEMMQNNDHGILIPPHNKEALIKSMKKFITDQDFISHIKENLKEKKSFFEPKKVYKKIESVFI